MAPSPTAQRTFRFDTDTLERLDRRARELGESRNRLAQRLLDEAVPLEQHPLAVRWAAEDATTTA